MVGDEGDVCGCVPLGDVVRKVSGFDLENVGDGNDELDE